jgi:hypothetical protein
MPVKCMPLTATPMISAAMKSTSARRSVTVNHRATVPRRPRYRRGDAHSVRS